MGEACRRIAFATLAAVVTACGSDVPEETREAAVRPVKLLTLEAAGSGQSRRYPAVVKAAKSSQLTFQVSGLLQELPVTEAQQVDQGTLLAKLDPRDYQSKLDSAKAEYDNAETEYQRARRLAEGDAIATSELEQRQSRRDTARAQLDAAEKAFSDTVLRAPFAGVIAKVHVEKFQNVPAQGEIVTLMGTGGLEATVNMPASIIAKSRAAEDTRSFSVVLEAAPSVRIPAQFKEAALEADTASQTYEVTFSFQPPEDLIILPGMNATVISEFSTGEPDVTASTGVAVPLSAVLSEGDRNFVWVIDPDAMTAAKRWVTIQAGVGETTIATDGLAAGETIAGAGATYLAEGMKVRPWTD